MRLLNSHTLKFEEFFDNLTPRYAILSHTWGDDEVLYKDMRKHRATAEAKAGFWKITACAAQAIEDGLGYIWVDTCCIDKSSSAELSEAINSMFRWYRRSTTCYAYLFDVPAPTVEPLESDSVFCDNLKKARWWKRGWTLQELLAPRKVTFYSREWHKLGTKHDPHLSRLIVSCSGLPEQVTREGNYRDYSVARRMSWAAQRSTSRVEDVAYCLMGLFDVYMPMLYGEGAQAFTRLQEEIMKKSDDPSILAWRDSNAASTTFRGILARTPSEFSHCSDIRWSSHAHPLRLQIFDKEVHLNVFLDRRANSADEFIASLPGVRIGRDERFVGLYLHRLPDGQYARVDTHQVSMTTAKHFLSSCQVAQLRREPGAAKWHLSRASQVWIQNRLPNTFSFKLLYQESWREEASGTSVGIDLPKELDSRLAVRFSVSRARDDERLEGAFHAKGDWDTCLELNSGWSETHKGQAIYKTDVKFTPSSERADFRIWIQSVLRSDNFFVLLVFE